MEFISKELIILLFMMFSVAAYDFVVNPTFVEKEQDLHVTAYVGQTSRLPCTVKHLSGKRVSWIRERDLQVLSTGRHTVSTDLRISVLSGRRLKPRSSRDLTSPVQFRSHSVFGRTDGYLKDHGNGDWMIKPAVSERSYSQGEEEDRIERYNPHFVSIGRRSSAMQLVSRNSSGYHRNPTLLNEDEKVKRLKRNVRGHYIYKRFKKGFGFNDNNPWMNADSSSNGKRNWYKEVKQSSDQYGRKTIKCLETFPKKSCESKEKTLIDIKEYNPIAIHPQGPATKATDPKTLKLSPHYIAGVWEPEDYTLQIKYAKPQDSGTYICQINTEPRIAQAVVLRVVEMKAEIVGRRELFVNAGNPVKLSCRINHGALMPGFILWYKGERLVEYENSGGRIRVLTEAGGLSHLLLNDVRTDDSSNYTCSPSGGESDSIILSVIVDERRAAMHQGNNCPSTKCAMSTLLFCTILLVCQHLETPAEPQQLISRCLLSAIPIGINPSSLTWSAILIIFVFLLALHHLQNEAIAIVREIMQSLQISSSLSIILQKAYFSLTYLWDICFHGRCASVSIEMDVG